MLKLKELLGLDRAIVKLKSGERVTVKPLTVRQSYVIEQAFAPIAETAAEVGFGSLELLNAHAKELVMVVAAGIDKEPEEVDEMDYEDFQKILGKLLEVNRNFFVALSVQGAARAAQKQKPTGA